MSLRIVMIGAGYVGLVSGACFADFGHSVVCVDVNEQKISQLNNDQMPIFEPKLGDLVRLNRTAGRLSFTTHLASAVSQADVVFIAVGTPGRLGEGDADLTYVSEAVQSVARALQGYTVIVTKSTVPVGTADEIERVIHDTNPDAEFSVVSNPEFLREGAAINDFLRPNRVILGAADLQAIRMMREVYRPLSLEPEQFMLTDRRTAELIKYASNAFLAMKVTFINEVADLCEKVDADVQSVARGMGLDTRIGDKFLNSGPGFGGSCFPKDTLALAKMGQDHGVPLRLVETTVASNDRRKREMANRIINACGGDVRGFIIGLLGITFKPGTDDMREAPSLEIIEILKQAEARVRVYDPAVEQQAKKVVEGVEYADDIYSLATDTDCVVLVTEWNEFRTIDLNRLRNIMNVPRLVDLRNVYRRNVVEAAGIQYTGIGQGATRRLASRAGASS